jgi:hypothetical protein
VAYWDVTAQRLRSSLGTIKEEVHEATRKFMSDQVELKLQQFSEDLA